MIGKQEDNTKHLVYHTCIHTLPFIPPPYPIMHKQFFFISPRSSLRLYQAMRPPNPKTSFLHSKSKQPTGSDASFTSMNNKSEQKAMAVATHQSRPPPPLSNTPTDGVAPTRSGDAATEEGSCCGRERMKRHWVDVAGVVWIPDIWGQEDLLKDWIDCSAFDSSLVGSSIMSARESLVEQGRRASSTREQLLIL